jgi:hypothetical protein
MREKMNPYVLLEGKSEGKRQIGRQRHGWADNIKMYLEDTRLGGMD